MTDVRLATVVAMGAVLAWASSCGSSSKTTTGSAADSQQVWASSVCNALLTWRSSIHTTAQKLKNTAELSKATIRQASGEVATADTTLLSSLENLGKPPTPAAAQAKTTVDQLSTQLKSSANKIHNAATSGESVSQAASVAKNELTGMSEAVSSSVKKLQSLQGSASAAWRKAFSSAKSCQTLAGS